MSSVDYITKCIYNNYINRDMSSVYAFTIIIYLLIYKIHLQ